MSLVCILCQRRRRYTGSTKRISPETRSIRARVDRADSRLSTTEAGSASRLPTRQQRLMVQHLSRCFAAFETSMNPSDGKTSTSTRSVPSRPDRPFSSCRSSPRSSGGWGSTLRNSSDRLTRHTNIAARLRFARGVTIRWRTVSSGLRFGTARQMRCCCSATA